jgi:hypothetical protein
VVGGGGADPICTVRTPLWPETINGEAKTTVATIQLNGDNMNFNIMEFQCLPQVGTFGTGKCRKARDKIVI